jgi:hypothetical protein
MTGSTNAVDYKAILGTPHDGPYGLLRDLNLQIPIAASPATFSTQVQLRFTPGNTGHTSLPANIEWDTNPQLTMQMHLRQIRMA